MALAKVKPFAVEQVSDTPLCPTHNCFQLIGILICLTCPCKSSLDISFLGPVCVFDSSEMNQLCFKSRSFMICYSL